MAPHTHSFISFLALLGAAPLVSTRALRNTFMPRQATPGFECSYPAGWESCNTKDSRDCWVRDPNGKEYNVDTDYEDNVPEGTTRIINLEIDEKDISPDGFTPQKTAQLINGKFPGELIEACWGDTLEVHVTNKLQRNGTTIHWHGIRQLGSNEMDGVNGVTQCPVSEDDTYVYKFKLTQYGHSWYHSHYSSQYSDGVAAPLLVHGPNTANWEEEWAPIIVNDWFHRSAFEAFHQSMTALPAPGSSILVDGHGHYQNSDGVVTGTYFERDFEPGKSYLLRIVNGGTDLHFQFSIDGHTLEVVHADFVPIKPYNTSSISVGIGQRYSVIVRANPETESSNGKYWIRTEYTTADGCNFAMDYPKPNNQDGMRTGIISYPNAGEGNPTSQRHSDIVVGCLDEKIEPRIPWTVSAPQNDVSKNTHFFAGNDRITQSHGFFRWELAETPLWINFSDPTILNLKNTTWNPEYAIEHYNYTNEEEFVYMIINSGNGTQNMFAGHHPIHLHGHDFAVISQGAGIFDPAVHTVNLNNPPRRDVAMLPNNGHLVLAFKPDNPGVWLIHCHIGWHAGSGLALQVLERQNEIAGRIGSLNPVQNGCQKWDGWMATHPNVFNYTMQEDSGI